MKDFLKYVTYTALFATPFILLWVSSGLFFPYITGKNFAWRILVEIAAGAWVLLALYDVKYRPRWSGITVAIATLVGVMFLANIFGEHAPKSFWSNYERMEGWVTLAHFFVYFVVLGSVLQSKKIWSWFLHTALVVAVIMSFIAIREVAGLGATSHSWRVDASLGNSTYLGVYMLFHIFIAAWLYVQTKVVNRRWIYAGLMLLFTYILFQTGTRGTILGLFGGGIITFGYLALMAPKGANIKKWALGGLLAVTLTATGLWAARDTAFVESVPMFDRVANITLAEGEIRFAVWSMAFEGFKERPILGWGQENFNYVFNKYYDPALYNAESWYDRTHNIFMDWLIAGGVVGLLAYLSVLVSALWYSTIRPLFARLKDGVIDESSFSVYEQSLILGLLAAYTFHNLFVFDNLASWVFYAIVLALVHSRVAKTSETMSSSKIDDEVLAKVAAPLGLVVTLVLIYVINYPGYSAAADLIDAHRSVRGQSEEAIVNSVNAHFDKAWNRGGFANQEIVEQSSQLNGRLLASFDLNEKEEDELVSMVEDKFFQVIEDKPGDARLHVVLGNFYKLNKQLDEALEQYLLAEKYSPTKQAILEEQGTIYMMAGKPELAAEKFNKAYELDKNIEEVRVRYAATLLAAGKENEFNEVLPREELENNKALWRAFTQDSLVLNVVYQQERYDLLELIVKARAEADPQNKDLRMNLAAFYSERGDTDKAISVIEEAMADIPDFKEEGEAIIRGIKNPTE